MKNNRNKNLAEAIISNNLNQVKKLLENSVDLNPDIKNPREEPPLMIACGLNNPSIEMIKLLLENGANPNGENFGRFTALMYSCFNNRQNEAKMLAITKLLLDHGADPNKQQFTKSTALHIASEFGYTSIVKLLLEHGADPNMEDVFKMTPLVVSLRSKWINHTECYERGCLLTSKL